MRDPYKHDVAGTSYIRGVTDFNFEALFVVVAMVVPSGDFRGAIKSIVMHPTVLARYLLLRLEVEVPAVVAEKVMRAIQADAGTLLGMPIVVDSSAPRHGDTYHTKVTARDGRTGVLVTREGR